MFYKQRQRLRREEKWTADMLAEELFAMFGPDVTLEHHGQIIIQKPENGPPIVIRGLSSGDTIISAPARESAVEDEDAVNIDVVAGDSGTTTTSTETTGGTSTFPGVIVSGTHPTYTVNVYTNGTTNSPESQQVTQLAGVTGVGLPANTLVTVYKDQNGDYWMNVPVWG